MADADGLPGFSIMDMKSTLWTKSIQGDQHGTQRTTLLKLPCPQSKSRSISQLRRIILFGLKLINILNGKEYAIIIPSQQAALMDLARSDGGPHIRRLLCFTGPNADICGGARQQNAPGRSCSVGQNRSQHPNHAFKRRSSSRS